jgi:hypothetical protein
MGTFRNAGADRGVHGGESILTATAFPAGWSRHDGVHAGPSPACRARLPCFSLMVLLRSIAITELIAVFMAIDRHATTTTEKGSHPEFSHSL